MDVTRPDAGFYLWPKTPISDTDFTLQLYQQGAIQVVPGSYLARDTIEGNPGTNRVRMALVAEVDQCIEAAHRIRAVIERL